MAMVLNLRFVQVTGGDSLIEGLEEDDVEELGIDDDDLYEGQFSDAEALEDFLNNLASSLDEDEEYNIEGFGMTNCRAPVCWRTMPSTTSAIG